MFEIRLALCGWEYYNANFFCVKEPQIIIRINSLVR